jgi:hypothetical protein
MDWKKATPEFARLPTPQPSGPLTRGSIGAYGLAFRNVDSATRDLAVDDAPREPIVAQP